MDLTRKQFQCFVNGSWKTPTRFLTTASSYKRSLNILCIQWRRLITTPPSISSFSFGLKRTGKVRMQCISQHFLGFGMWWILYYNAAHIQSDYSLQQAATTKHRSNTLSKEAVPSLSRYCCVMEFCQQEKRRVTSWRFCCTPSILTTSPLRYSSCYQ